MKKGIVAVSLFGMIYCAQAADLEAAKEKAVVCAACHGQEGISLSGAVGPNLAGQGQKYLLKQLRDFKSGERADAVMAAQVAALTDEDMVNLAAYFASFPAPPASTTGAGDEPEEMLLLGQALYRGGDMANGIPACAACHGPSGAGIEPAAFPQLTAQHWDYTRSQLQKFQAAATLQDQPSDVDKATIVARANDPNQMMQDVAKKMTPKQIEAVSRYIQGLN